jgi:hypothetical protein
MAKYEPIAHNDNEPPTLTSPSDDDISSLELPRTRFLRSVSYALLAVNLLLAIIGGSMSFGIGASLAEILPANDLRALPQPDAYYGLPISSRMKSECTVYWV